jgi:hypothetical protein
MAGVCAALALLALLTMTARSGMLQQAPSPPGGTSTRAPSPQSPGMSNEPGMDDNQDPAMVEFQRRQAMMRNAERQKDLVKDTQKLYDLASQLKDEVAKTNKDTMSIDVIKKADEIEKLAKSVSNKMKGD